MLIYVLCLSTLVPLGTSEARPESCPLMRASYEISVGFSFLVRTRFVGNKPLTLFFCAWLLVGSVALYWLLVFVP
jgi:hypothetical protein